MLGCHNLFGEERGSEVKELIEYLTDSTCPCRTGRACPLLPQDSMAARDDSPAMTA